jgi:lambda family phage tail tape measure protein
MAPVTTELKVLVKAIGKGELKELEAALGELSKTARTKVNVNFKQVGAELKKIQSTSVQSIQNLRDYRNAWRDIANQLDVSSKEFKDARAEAERLDKQLAKIQGRRKGGAGGRLRAGAQIAGTIAGAGVFGGIEGALGAGIGAFFGPGGAIVGGAIGAQIGQLRQALGVTAEYAAELKKLQIALLGVTTSQEEYGRALSFIQETTKTFAIPQEIVTRQFTKLQASVQGAGGNLEDTRTAFNGIVAAVRATGGSLADVDAALTATAQVFSKGKVSAEELRQQIGERLPGAFTLFAESIGLTPQELDKALEKGQVSLQDFQVFAKALFERYGKTAEIIAKAPESAGDRLQVALEKMNESVGKILQPIGAAFQDLFTGIANAITRAANALDNFLGISPEKKLNATIERINNINLDLAALRREEAAAASVRPEADLLGSGAAFTDPSQDLSRRRQELERQRDLLRQEANDISRRLQAQSNVAQPKPGGGLAGTDPSAGERGRDPMVELRRQANEAFRDLEASFAAVAETRLAEDLRVNALAIAEARESGNKASQFQLELQRKLIPLQVSEEALVFQIAKRQEQIKKERAKNIDVGNQARALLKDETSLTKVRAELESKRAEFAQDLADFNKKNLKETLKLEDERLEKVREYNELLKEQTQIEDPMQGFKAGLDSYVESLGTAFDAVKNLTETALGGLSDAISKLVTEGTFNFKEFASSLLRDMADIIVRGIVMRSILQIFNIGVPAVSGKQALEAGYNMGSSLAGMFANGGIMTGKGPLELKTYARGGVARSPQLAMFGEGSLPEAYVPLPDGRSIPVTMRGGGAGNIVVNVDAKGTQVEGDSDRGRQLGSAISAAVQAELIKQQRPGGLLNR